MKKRKAKYSRKLMALQIDDWDKAEIQEKADKYANGNVSAWMRYASRMYTPKKGQRILRAG